MTPGEIKSLSPSNKKAVEAAARNYALFGLRLEELKDKCGDAMWSRLVRRQLKLAAHHCAQEVARILSTALGHAIWILDDFRCALEDAEQGHDPAGFIGWLIEEAELTGYLDWMGETESEAAE